jgi:hypothetical protein
MRFLLRRQELVSHNSVRINFDQQIELWRFWFGANQIHHDPGREGEFLGTKKRVR